MIAALVLLLVQQPVVVETLQLEGPLTGVRVEVPSAGSTQLGLSLLRGESLRLQLPLPAGAPAGSAAWVALGAGAVRVVEAAGPKREPSQPLPGRPPARGVPGVLPLGALAAILAGALAVAGLRRRVLLACVASVVTAVGASLLAAPAGPSQDVRVRVLDGEVGRPGWTWTDGSRGELEIPSLEGAYIWSEPEGRPWRWRGVLAGSAEEPRWWLDVEQSDNWVRAELRPGMRVLAPELNGWGPLDAVWSRSPGAPWAYHGSWAQGEALPSAHAEAGEASLPSWLPGGLPAASGAILARLAPGTFGGPGRPPEVWLRIVLN